MLAFVVPSVVTESSCLSQFFGVAIRMCVAIGGCVIGKISEGSLNPEAYSGDGISMGCSDPAGALGIDGSSAHVGFVNHPIDTLFKVIGPALAVAFYWIARLAKENSKIKGLVPPAAKLVSEFLGKPMLGVTVGLNVLNGSTADAFSGRPRLDV